MHFAYEGFTHRGDSRCFQFRGISDRDPVDLFRIEIGLLLFAKNKILVQDGPRFCLQMLETASTAGPGFLDRLHSYSVVSDDFRSLVVERERKIAEKALKAPPRRPFRKPPADSNLSIGIPSASR
ncbi:MAG: hypothetical protein M3Y72_24045 [Acidobacteriota bacterium]|nr:hypothetical protein [Acidobacteriota bacterium]